ncbi:hypothetical protein NFI96_030940 [Prochilodus magdalenae]|nr:hypothetical protein NFI96_030940 [Prochilodus magdalenae]
MLGTVRVNPQTSTKDLQHDLAADGVTVHHSTIRRTLHKEMLYGSVMQRKPFLHPHHKQSRLRLTDASSINDLVSKSHKLTEGPPAWHRLHTTKCNLDKNGKIRKWTFGEKLGIIQNSTILVVGETETGKTTLINTMVNYFLGVKFEDKVWFEITEEKKRDQTETQTSEVTVYEIISKERLSSLTIIDTPGYGDTRGIEKDMDIARNLHDLFLHDAGVKDLDAVCLVLKASQNRISDRQRYIFEGVLSLFGKDIEDIIVLCITHSDGGPPTDALEAVKKEKIPCCYNNEAEPVHFIFNNRQSERHTQQNEQVYKSAWEMGECSMEEFFEFRKSRQRKSVTLTVSVLNERMQLEARVESLKELIKFSEAKHSELTEAQKALEQNKEKIEEDEKFPFTVTTVYREKVDITGASWWDRMVTSCEECQETCHEYNCWVARNAEWCEVMKGQRCTACGCPDSKHIRKYKKYVTKLRQKEVTFKTLKSKYSDTFHVSFDKSEFRKMEEKLKMNKEMMKLEIRLETLLTENEEKKKSLVKEACMTILKLSEIALKPDSAFTIQYLDFLIPRVEEAGTAEWAQELKDLQRAAAAQESTNSAVGFNYSSSALNDFIRESDLLNSGPPAQRRLYTTRSPLKGNDKVRKWTFGQKYGNLQNKTILMVGETGTGKTTLINTMVNYFLGVRFEDKVWFEITEEEQRDPSKSQTSEVTVYEIIFEDRLFSLTIIDTPGYGHTEGIEKDKEIARNLHDLFLNGVKDLDAVCLVLKASQNRISDRQRYIFEGVLSLFGKDIEDNIVLCITHSDGGPPTNALGAVKKEKVPCCYDDEDNEPVHFLFNNRQSEKRTTKYEQNFKSSWEMGERGMKRFFKFLKSRQRKSVTLTVSVLNEREQLEACVESLMERIKFSEAKHSELTEVQKTLEQNKEKIEEDEKFPFTVTTVYREKVDITGASWRSRKATSCDECQQNCHEKCWFAGNAKWCKVMKDGSCTKCGCPDSKHVREGRKYETKERQETVTFKQLKLKYSDINQEKASYNKSKFEKMEKEHEEKLKKNEEVKKLESDLNTRLAKNDEERRSLVKEAYVTVIKLSEIALKPDSAFTIQHLDFLIPRVEEAGKAEWAQELKDLQRAAAKKSK